MKDHKVVDDISQAKRTLLSTLTGVAVADRQRFRMCRALSLSISLVMVCLVPFPVHGHDPHDELHHWEIPSKDPDRIILTFHGDPSCNRAVTWRTNKEITNAVAQIAEATVNSKFTEKAVTRTAATESFDLGMYKGNTSLMVNYHSVVFDDLKPNTLYAYRVGDGGKHWSEWIQFRTATEGYAPCEFVYFGDAQNNILAHWSRLIRMAYETAPKASFAIHAGDLVNDAHRDHEWAQWYKAGGFIHRQWTSMPAVGNHEFKSVAEGENRKLAIQWRPQFTLPIADELPLHLHETVYSVDYQGIRFIVLNSNDHLDQQTEYLEAQLKDCDARWKVIVCHHSVFSPAKGRNFQYARAHWKPLLDKYGVDLVLNGHDHTYARGHVPVRTTDGDPTGELGTIYVTSVSGPKQYELESDQLESYAEDGYRVDKTGEQTQFFQVISIRDETLTYVAYTVLGEEYDRAVIVKNFETGRKTLQLPE